MFDFDRIIDRKNTNCAKYDLASARGYPEDVLPLWVADMDFAAPDCVRQALHKAVDHGIFGYSLLGDDYYAAVQNWFARRFALQIQKEWLVTTPGVVFAICAGIRAVTEPGDAVLVQPPVYYPFSDMVKRNGRTLVESPLVYREGRYTIDFADFEKKVAENPVKVFLLCSPHNPVCRVWTKDELKRLGSICKKYGVTVIADEIHCDFAFPEYPHTPFLLACPDLEEQTILCTSPSKSFNLAGLQVSNIIIPGKDLREAFCRQVNGSGYDDPNRLGMIACQAAYQEGAPWLDACKAYMRGNLDYVRTFLKENLPQIRLVEPEGTYFAWLDCTGLGMTEEMLNDLIVNKAKLWLDSGSIFGSCAAQFQRIVLACPRATLEQALARLAEALRS